MKRLVSCMVTFTLAFSMLGAPSLSFASAPPGSDASFESAQFDIQDSITPDESAGSESADTASTDKSASSASDATQAAPEHKAPVPDNTIDVSTLKNADGTIPQVTSAVRVVGDDSLEPDNTSTFSDEQIAILEGMLLAQAEGDPVTTTGSEIEGSALTVTLHSFRATPSADLRAKLYDKATHGLVKEAAFSKPTSDILNAAVDAGFVANLSAAERIPVGEYSLEIAGDGYGAYVHDLTVENGNRINISISDNPENIYTVSDTFGLIPYGDFNNDGVISNTDVKLLTSACQTGAKRGSSSYAAKYDMDDNGTLDLADVQHFAASLAEGASQLSDADEIINDKQGKANIRKDVSSATASTESTFTIKYNAVDENGEVVAKEWSLENKSQAELNAMLSKTLLEDTGALVSIAGENPANSISDSNPVQVTITPPSTKKPDGTVEQAAVYAEGAKINSDAMNKGVVTVEGEDEAGNVVNKEIAFAGAAAAQAQSATTPVEAALRATSQKAYGASEGAAEVNADHGYIKVDFGERIAIKKITIKITETTTKDAKLVEIGTVEFLNNMEDLIAPPDLSIPKNIVATPGKKRIDVSWDEESNVSGYEIRYEMNGNGVNYTIKTNSHTLQQWPYSLMKDVKSGTYSIRVRSVSGEWTSPWSAPVEAVVVASEPPKRPSSLNVKSGYKELIISWPSVDDAEWYNLEYKINNGGASWVKYPNNITATSLTLSNLSIGTEYIVRLTASNKLGTSAYSDEYAGTPYGASSVKVPWYKLINRTVQDNSMPSHITDMVVYPQVNGTTKDMIDGNYDTYLEFKNQYMIAEFTFDKEYEMNTVAVTTALSSSLGYNAGGLVPRNTYVTVTDEAGTETTYRMSTGELTASSIGATAPNSYYLYFPTSKVKKFKFEHYRYYGAHPSISEIAFYENDGIADGISALWADNLHTTLNDNVTAKTISDLRDKVNTPDPDGDNEYTPKKETFLKQLDEAENVLNNLSLFRKARYYDSSINGSVNVNVGGINGWQPLGISAYEGDELEIFVACSATDGSNPYAAGINTALRLYITQYNDYSDNTVMTLVGNLKTGQNSVTIPSELSSLNAEKGGQLYVELLYNDSTKNQKYGVRVLGGHDIATLDLHGVTDAKVRQEREKQYVEDLVKYCADSTARHSEHKHPTTGSLYEYSAATCVANTTDIVLDDMMYSVAASQILNGLGTGDTDAKVAKLDKALQSMEYMMKLFYQHKGLTNDMADVTAYGSKNGIPQGHLNLRQKRQKAGVFMYAAGNHIGIPFGSTALSGVGFINYNEETGAYESGTSFGWGIAHEIGHNINQRQYTIAEVTNNYYAQLITNYNQPQNEPTLRFSYDSIFDRVTSGTYSPLAGKTGIACYWQLHLAYDNFYDFKVFDNYADQMNNLIFARMDAYARNPESAPVGTEKQIKLSLAGCSTNDSLARLACAATQKNLVDYFDAWGLKLTDATKAYASQFPEEERLIQYVCEPARYYRVEGGSAVDFSKSSMTAELYANGQKINSETKVSTNEITIKVDLGGVSNASSILGYEILRNGSPVAFKRTDGSTTSLEYTDVITTENNRTYEYSVRAVDKLLNASESITLPRVKVATKNFVADKSDWIASTNMESDADVKYGNTESNLLESGNPLPCEGEVQKAAIDNVLDGDSTTSYTGKLPEHVYDGEGKEVTIGDPYVEINLSTKKKLTAITVPTSDADTIRSAKLEVSENVDPETEERTWVSVPKRTEVPDAQANTTTFYFDEENDTQLKIYNAGALRLTWSDDTFKTSGVTLHEIDVVGVSNDNIDFLDQGGVGKITADIPIGKDSEGNNVSIPGDAAYVFCGTYSGDTAYNAIKLYDKDGYIIPGTQIFFADKPGEGRSLGTTADGRWIYYVTAEDVADYEKYNNRTFPVNQKVYATLYRVDDAMTLANERAVADTLGIAVPAKADLPTLSITVGAGGDYQYTPPSKEGVGAGDSGGNESGGIAGGDN